LRIGKTKRAVDLLSDKRFVKLDANLRYFREKYDAILASHDERHNRLASVRGTPYRRVDTAGAPVGSGQGSALAHQRIPGTARRACQDRSCDGVAHRAARDSVPGSLWRCGREGAEVE
jgi:hypothetical protein